MPVISNFGWCDYLRMHAVSATVWGHMCAGTCKCALALTGMRVSVRYRDGSPSCSFLHYYFNV